MAKAQWEIRHDAAIANPRGVEAAILKMLDGVDIYCREYYERFEKVPGDDYVLGDEGLKPILQGLLTLLNGDLDRLDAGRLDSRILGLAQTYGFVLD